MIRKVILNCFLISVSFSSISGQGRSQTEYLQTFEVKETQSQSFSVTIPVTAIAVRCDCEGQFRIKFGDQQLSISKDPDTPTPTFFISLPNPIAEFTFESVQKTEDFEVFLIHSGEAPAISEMKERILKSNECFEPLVSVPQTEWRAGLPEPNYSRSFHDVNHNIVHHSAGSNSSTNYTQVVRDIYLYHTQVNGWSDIGYNYLIAQDGTIYKGRDPAEGSQDEVRGAHFCGANSATLGICLLGNYETATPTSPSIISLESMLTYQLLDQDTDPFASFNHSLGSIGSIAGHRDGCATLCPGENVYEMLNEIRADVSSQMEGCSPSIPLSIEVDSTLVAVGETIILNAIGSYDDFYWSIDGAFPGNPSGASVSVSFGIPGSYDVSLVGVNQQVRDTLQLTDFFKVSYLTDRPILFPNPTKSDRMLTIDSKEEIDEITIHSVTGKILLMENSNRIDLHGISAGLYLVKIKSGGNIYRERLAIH